MKKIIANFIVLALFAFINPLSAQNSCKVLLADIDSVYTGKCKKGLAHGNGLAIGADTYKGKFKKGLPSGRGTYIWANGDKYSGQWKDGMRDGIGVLTLKVEEQDSIIDGLWKEDIYKGPKPTPPKVIRKISIDRYSIRDNKGTQNRVLIDFYQNGGRNMGITNLIITSTSGVETSLGKSIGYEFVEFPVIIKVNYETLNKLKAEKYQAIFEFEITDPGEWIVEIHN